MRGLKRGREISDSTDNRHAAYGARAAVLDKTMAWTDALALLRDTAVSKRGFPETPAGPRPVRWRWVPAGVAAVAGVLALLPGRTSIPPLVESDYCYLLTAADRLYEGLGPTTPLPVAPGQPWTWERDWAFLTRWPIGYPLLICAVRWITGQGTVDACRCISVVACAMSLVGWYLFVRRNVPRGVTANLLAAVAAGSSVSAASLVNPSTDGLLVAAVPFVLLLTMEGVGGLPPAAASWSPLRRGEGGPSAGTPPGNGQAAPRSLVRLAFVGLAAGWLFWIRYAAVFVPVAVGFFLVLERRRRRTVSRCGILVFAAGMAAPIAALLLMHRAFGTSSPMQQQLNLGHTVKFAFSPSQVATAWWRFTDLGFYDYHRWSHWLYAFWPMALVICALFSRSIRGALRSFVGAPGVRLSVLVAVVLLGLLVGVTAVFGDKYDYVSLDRYYAPVKPLYYVIAVAPLLSIRRRLVRIGLCAAFLVAGCWIVQQEWPRPYRRWLAAHREVTPYGQWARPFSPRAAALYHWLNEQKSDRLIVISNFPDSILLETQIPACPIPPDADTLHLWIQRIGSARGISRPKVLFVLDPDNRWRDSWLPDPSEIVRSFGLHARAPAPASISAWVMPYHGCGVS